MSENIYSAPSAKLVNDELADDLHFYIVASRKFWILFIVTFTTYQLYWQFKNWSNYRLRTDASLWPVPRAIFSIFFTHSLFQKIDNRLKVSGANYSWSPMTMATLFVFLVLANNICSSLSEAGIGLPYTFVIYLIAASLIGWPLFSAQKAANLACDDPLGHSNKRMTAANIAWIVVFGLVWILIIFGIWVLYEEAKALSLPVT